MYPKMKNFQSLSPSLTGGNNTPSVFSLVPRQNNAVRSARVLCFAMLRESYKGVLRTLFVPTALALSALAGCNSTSKPLSHNDSVTIAKAIVTKHIDSIKRVKGSRLLSVKPVVDSTTKADSPVGINPVCMRCLIELVGSSGKFKDLSRLVANKIDFNVVALNPEYPSTRANGQKIYRGYEITATENMGGKNPIVGVFQYDLDIKGLYWCDISEGVSRLLYSYDNTELQKVFKYCDQ